jgi:hypothetical protein
MFTVCERVICVNRYESGATDMPLAPFDILPLVYPLINRVKWRSPSEASMLDGAFVVRAFSDVAHNVGVGITLPVRSSSQS